MSMNSPMRQCDYLEGEGRSNSLYLVELRQLYFKVTGKCTEQSYFFLNLKMPPKIRDMASMSSVTQSVNFLLVWAYLSSLNVSTGQSKCVRYAEGRARYSQQRVYIGRELG